MASWLGEVGPAGAPSARRTARPDDLHLEVRGVGTIALPVPVRQAKQLCLVGRPARFGKGEHTILDRGVRDTWEIPRSRVKIDKQRWDRTLRPMLDKLRAGLGLPAGCRLTAEFHAMLVYGPGQFFAPHQDSEKADTMIGTLVVMLPSDSQGGALVVEHAGTSVTYRPSKTSLSFVAFYADCRHEVRPVTAGYRVVLTYNLLLDGDTTASVAARVDAATAQHGARLLDEHFSTRMAARYGGADRDPPNRLVYLLDHEYTERGLSWARLKGRDAGRAAALAAAADAAGCDAVLALANIHEVWQAYDEPEPDWHRGYDWDDDDDYGDEGEYDDDWSGEPHLQELVASTVHLDQWLIDPGSLPSPTSLRIDDDEVCATTPTVRLTPYSSEYEGYMGNYGNTADRWYRRAAIVVWPRRFAFAVRAEASPEWALDTLAQQIRVSDLAGAQAAANTLAPVWDRSMRATQRPGLLSKALRVARDLGDPGLATMLLTPFSVETLTKRDVALAADVANQYGPTWTDHLLSVWFRENGRWYVQDRADRRAWLTSLPSLCSAASTHPANGRVFAAMLVARSWAWLRREIEQSVRQATPSVRAQGLAALGTSVAAVLASAAACGATDRRDEAVAFLSSDNDDLLALLLPAVRSASTLDPAVRTESGLDSLAEHCTARLTTRLARPVRAADDWSIAASIDCRCALCAALAAFLHDPVRRSYEWPLAEAGRRHIHQMIDIAELPVTHRTRRQGRPYTLVLTKTDAIFVRERQRREQDEADLAWLTDHRTDPGRPTRSRRPVAKRRPRS